MGYFCYFYIFHVMVKKFEKVEKSVLFFLRVVDAEAMVWTIGHPIIFRATHQLFCSDKSGVARKLTRVYSIVTFYVFRKAIASIVVAIGRS